MKRRLLPVAALLPALLLQGCSLFECSIRDDFEQYKKLTMGNCDFETDGKPFILPSEDFIDRFEFENARYYHFARPDLDFSDKYTFSYLYFEYGEEIYLEAKGFMLNETKPFDDHYEYYKDFVFTRTQKPWKSTESIGSLRANSLSGSGCLDIAIPPIHCCSADS